MSSGQTAKTFLDTVQAHCFTKPDLHIACELFSQAGYKHIDENDVIACRDYILACRAYKAALEALEDGDPPPTFPPPSPPNALTVALLQLAERIDTSITMNELGVKLEATSPPAGNTRSKADAAAAAPASDSSKALLAWQLKNQKAPLFRKIRHFTKISELDKVLLNTPEAALCPEVWLDVLVEVFEDTNATLRIVLPPLCKDKKLSYTPDINKPNDAWIHLAKLCADLNKKTPPLVTLFTSIKHIMTSKATTSEQAETQQMHIEDHGAVCLGILEHTDMTATTLINMLMGMSIVSTSSKGDSELAKFTRDNSHLSDTALLATAKTEAQSLRDHLPVARQQTAAKTPARGASKETRTHRTASQRLYTGQMAAFIKKETPGLTLEMLSEEHRNLHQKLNLTTIDPDLRAFSKDKTGFYAHFPSTHRAMARRLLTDA